MTCFNDFLFCEHRIEEKAARKRLSKAVMQCVESTKIDNLQRVASRYELESDEFSTAYEKASGLV
jgi:nucleoid-associated protein YejK